MARRTYEDALQLEELMSGIGNVTSVPTPTPTDDTTATPPSTDPTTPSVTRTGGPGRPVVATPTPTAKDIVPASILSRYGLDPDKLTTESHYTGNLWNVGYYPYSGDIQYIAFGKYKSLFQNADGADDGHAYWEGYSDPPSGLTPGSWIPSGGPSEADFEITSGVNMTGDCPVGNDTVKLLREAGAPSAAQFALRDQSGKALPVQAGDTLVPTTTDGSGNFVPVEPSGSGAYSTKDGQPVDGSTVVWRIEGQDGTIRGSATDTVEDRTGVLGLKSGVKFNFLDSTGQPVPYDPSAGDAIVATTGDASALQVLVPQRDSTGTLTGYTHDTFSADGKTLESSEQLAPAAGQALLAGKDVTYRVLGGDGALRGSGTPTGSYDMGWWGKCHNVAAIGSSNMKMPQSDVHLVTNVSPGDDVGLAWPDGTTQHVLAPKRDASGSITGYSHQVRDAQGAVTSSSDLSTADATALAAQQSAKPIVLRGDGTLSAASVTTVGTDEVTALTAHMGNGAVDYEGMVGERFWGYPDEVQLKDGSTKSAFITGVTTEAGQQVSVGSVYGHDYYESDRSALRGPGLSTGPVSAGSRQVSWSSETFDSLQSSKEDKIKSLDLAYPDGHTETVPADQINWLGWENRWSVTPTDLWSMHAKVGDKASSIIQQDPGTHIWNYTITNMDTTPLGKDQLTPDEVERAKRPGVMAGTTDDAGKYYFETHVNGHDYRYWAKFDDQGALKDYAYLGDDHAGFFWTEHVKDPIASTWTGEAQARGVRMEDVQRLYNASTGALAPYELPGGVMSFADLSRPPVSPP